jgi:hypothetical protein
MLERHYNKLTATMAAGQLASAGKSYAFNGLLSRLLRNRELLTIYDAGGLTRKLYSLLIHMPLAIGWH